MITYIVGFHELTYIQILVFGVMAIVWGASLIVQKSSFTDGFRSILYATAWSGVLQAFWGIILYVFFGLRPNDTLHLVYGLIVVAAIPVAFTYTSEKLNRRDMLIITFAAVMLVAAAIRGFFTGK